MNAQIYPFKINKITNWNNFCLFAKKIKNRQTKVLTEIFLLKWRICSDANPTSINALPAEIIVPITSAYFFFFNAVVQIARNDWSQVGGYVRDWSFAWARTFINGGGFGSVRVGSDRRLDFRDCRCDL